MRRRTFLGLLGSTTGLAGCLQAAPASDGDSESGSQSLPVARAELTRALARDGIPAVVDPVFGSDWAGLSLEVLGPQGFTLTIEPRLSPDDRVIGVERDGQARAYPLSVLRWHEVVNDAFHGPLLVTYCPLCRSAVTAERTAGGRPATFGVSGLLWRHNLVLYDDRTESKWSQLTATAIRGPRTGDELALAPSTLTTWGAWQAAHPDTRVLRPPPESGTVTDAPPRNYQFDPYVGYAAGSGLGPRADRPTDDRLHPKTLVVGVRHGGAARAYPLPRVVEAGVVNDTVGGLPVVVTTGHGNTLVAYERTIGGRTYRFERSGDTLRTGDVRWNPTTGRALGDQTNGYRLTPAAEVPPLYWFAWLDIAPETDIWTA